MSSLANSGGLNYYVPPDGERKPKDRSNQFRRNNVVRLEMPFDGWCTVCNAHVAKGLRFNAHKEAVGKYFSTTIWKFSMKCVACKAVLEMKTDPKNRSYAYVGNLRKHVHDFEPDESDGMIVFDDGTSRRPLCEEEGITVSSVGSTMDKMEEELVMQQRAEARREALLALEQRSATVVKDDYGYNAALRSAHRSRRREVRVAREEGQRRGLPLHVPLAAELASDAWEAKAVFKQQRKRKANAALTSATVQEEKALQAAYSKEVLPRTRSTHKPSKTSTTGGKKKVNRRTMREIGTAVPPAPISQSALGGKRGNVEAPYTYTTTSSTSTADGALTAVCVYESGSDSS